MTTNVETGEQFESVFEEGRKRGNKPHTEESGFLFTFPKSLRPLGLTASEHDVLMHLVERMDPKGVVRYRLRDIAALLDVTEASAWRVVDGLVQKGAAMKYRRGEVLLNPYPMWRGHLTDRSSAIIKWHSALANEQRERSAS